MKNKNNKKKTMPLNKVLGPDIPDNPCFFLKFPVFLSVFLEVFWFLAVLVADKSFRSPKPKKPDENQKKQRIMFLKKVFGPNIPENAVPFFSVLWRVWFRFQISKKPDFLRKKIKSMQNGRPHSAAFWRLIAVGDVRWVY